MRRPFVMAGVLLALGTCHAEAQERREYRMYDSRGRYQGRAEADDRATKYYDSRGRCTGRDERQGGTVRRYDDRGRSAGRVDRPERGGRRETVR